MSAPWFKFYPSDWRADPALRMCSIGARGLWMEMLCVMHEAEPRGSLLVNGNPVSERQLAGLAGCSLKEVTGFIEELEAAGVFSRDNGAIYSRRMRRDDEKAERDKANGRNGGNPALKRGVNPQDKAQKPEARSQNSDAHASGEATSPPPAPAPDPVDEAVEGYNLMADDVGWPKAQRVTAARRAALKARLRECGGIEGWRAAMAKARASPFLMGDHDRDWRPSLDFFLQAKSFTKLMEGAYDRSSRPAAGQREPDRGPTQSERGRTLMAEVLAGRHDSRLSAAPPRPPSPVGPAEGGGSGDVLPFGEPPGTRVNR